MLVRSWVKFTLAQEKSPAVVGPISCWHLSSQRCEGLELAAVRWALQQVFLHTVAGIRDDDVCEILLPHIYERPWAW